MKLIRLAFAPLVVATLASVVALATVVDLTPKVESDFFFASDDPALQSSNAIASRFPTGEQVFLSARVADPLAPETLEKIDALSTTLAAVPGVTGVQSLTSGPLDPKTVPGSPLWGRLLLVADDPSLTNLVVSVSGDAQTDLVAQLEPILARHDSPSFVLRASGVPYAVEQIRRALKRDLRTFSLAALIAFGLLIALIYRSWHVVVGTLTCCVAACAVTLTVLHVLGVPIGVLTANIVTIVFVLTLSHIVFLTANGRRLAKELATEATTISLPAVAGNLAERAVAMTLPASFWAMLTTLLGFGSLLLAHAKPLRELAVSGMVGTLVAIAMAYGLYPRMWRPAANGKQPDQTNFGRPIGWVGAAVLAVVTLVAAPGLFRIETDPSLLDFFAEGGEIRDGIALIDDSGGSSPLLIEVGDPAAPEGKLDDADSFARLEALQQALDADPATGMTLSLPLLVAEARLVPLARFLPLGGLISVLGSPQFDNIARSFLTEDRTRALFLVRMREQGRTEPRRVVINRLEAMVAKAGLETAQVGGIYDLQARLGALVRSSLITGLGALMVLFAVVAILVARGARVASAMVISLVAVPIVLLGVFGHAKLPVDFISSPAANVAIALGIDGMIHLVSAVRRRRREGDGAVAAWRNARAQLAPPVLGAMAILAGGFGLFALSSFPPTQRFGLAVALGTLAAAAMTLLVLPALATIKRNPS